MSKKKTQKHHSGILTQKATIIKHKDTKNAHYTYMQRSRIFRSRRDFLTNTNTNPLQKPCNGSNIPKQTCKISQQTSENDGTSDRKCPDMFAKISAHVTPTEKKGSKT